MGSSTRKYSNIAKKILGEGNHHIQNNGKGLAQGMKGVLNHGNSIPRKKISGLSSSLSFKTATTILYSILKGRKGELIGSSGKKYNIIINEIVEECGYTYEQERVALKRVLRKTEFKEETNIWSIISDFFKELLKTFFSESVMESVSDILENELDEEVIEDELDIIADKVDYNIDRDDSDENISNEDLEKELVLFNKKVKLAFGG
jgi:1,2-phenylacetyl-CoA epoxidase catalytic subunit